jgi:hypothetical protein
MILHWNGSNWLEDAGIDFRVKTTIQGNLLGIKAISPNEVWAVGLNDNETLVAKWNEGGWTIVPTPRHGRVGGDYPIAVDGISSSNVWAVGTSTLIMHWNGADWEETHAIPERAFNSLNSLVVRSGNDIWAVGGSTVGGPLSSSIVHWNGSTWSEVEHPILMPDQDFYYVSPLDEGNIIAVGAVQPRGQLGRDSHPLVAIFIATPCTP